MKDIKFTGGALTSQVVFRVDSINGTNLTVMETYGLNDRQQAVIDTELERSLIKAFPKIPSTLGILEQFAVDNGLDLVISDTNAENEVQLKTTLSVAAPVQSSSTADTTPTFSGKGTPGGVVSITIASTTVTTTVDPSGNWTVDFSVLTSGAKSALVSLVKSGVAAAPITRAFTIS